MCKKIKKTLGYGSLMMLMVAGIYPLIPAQCHASNTVDCFVGIYPKEQGDVRRCANYSNKQYDCWLCTEEKQCHDAVEAYLYTSVNFYGVKLWDLFYKNYNSVLRNKAGKTGLTCEEWRDDCPNCDASGRSVLQEKKRRKTPSMKKPAPRSKG